MIDFNYKFNERIDNMTTPTAPRTYTVRDFQSCAHTDHYGVLTPRCGQQGHTHTTTAYYITERVVFRGEVNYYGVDEFGLSINPPILFRTKQAANEWLTRNLKA